jgi:REP element-mobilizing transposase RayT
MAEWGRKFNVSIWCSWLMPNHIHLTEMNPVRANLDPDPYAWKWSSAKAHSFLESLELSLMRTVKPLKAGR